MIDEGSLFEVTLFFKVECLNECEYSIDFSLIKPESLPQIQEESRARKMMPFESILFKVDIQKYYLKEEVVEFTFRAVTENLYQKLELEVSKDAFFVSRLETQITQASLVNGQGFTLVKSDAEWCTNCSVYMLLSGGAEETKMLVQTVVSSTNRYLSMDAPQDVFMQAQQKNCWGYSVTEATQDLLIEIQEVQGQTEVYVEPRQMKFENASFKTLKHPKRAIVISSFDKGSFSSGLYYLCFHALLPSSLTIKASEHRAADRILAESNTLYSFYIPAEGAKYLAYQFSLEKEGALHFVINMEMHSKKQKAAELLYRVCLSTQLANCYLSEEEFMESKGLRKVPTCKDHTCTFEYLDLLNLCPN